MLDRLVKAEMELGFAGLHHHRHRHLQDHRRPSQRTRPHAILQIRHAKDGRPPPCFNRAGNKLASGSVVPFDNLECTRLNIDLTAAYRAGQA
jgi:hypothetical protein